MRFILVLATALALAGCVHKVDVQQGNFVTQDVVDRVKPGMTKAEVRQLLGTPLLSDVFHANQWDYYFSHTKGRRAEDRTRLSIFFKDDKVVDIKGAGRPPGPPAAASK